MRWLAYTGGVSAVALLTAAGALYGAYGLIERLLGRAVY